MDKTDILRLIIDQLAYDQAVQFNAAKNAHEASTHEENIPDNKYETLALEASYIAQGQANRAQEIKRTIECYKQLKLQQFSCDSKIDITALVTLENEIGTIRKFFIGPMEGGMKLQYERSEIVVITPASPLGKNLVGKSVGDTVMIGTGTAPKEFEIIKVC